MDHSPPQGQSGGGADRGAVLPPKRWTTVQAPRFPGVLFRVLGGREDVDFYWTGPLLWRGPGKFVPPAVAVAPATQYGISCLFI